MTHEHGRTLNHRDEDATNATVARRRRMTARAEVKDEVVEMQVREHRRSSQQKTLPKLAILELDITIGKETS